MSTGALLCASLLAAGSVLYYRQNRRQRYLQDCVDTFGFQPTHHALTKRQSWMVDQVIEHRREKCRRLRRLVLAYSMSRPLVAQKYLDDFYIAHGEYQRAERLKQRMPR